MITLNPFAVLGLPPWPDLDDETVQAAWHAIAHETFPGRPGGGDPARYTQAWAAYAELRTRGGREQACAALAGQASCDHGGWPAGGEPPGPVVVVLAPVPLRDIAAMAAEVPARVRRGHPVRLLLRAGVIAGLCLALVTIFPGSGLAAYAAAVLALYFAVSARHDLAPPGW